MEFVDGGVTAPCGFVANGLCAGIKKGSTKEDLALIFSEKPCSAAGVFTQNVVKAEPVKLSRLRLNRHKAQAVIANSGYANACTGDEGAWNAVRMTRLAACSLSNNEKIDTKIDEDDVLVCSTGIIGQQVPINVIEEHMDELVDGLSKEGHEKARTAIMTTDTKFKECAVETEIGGKKVRIGTMAKGSGMIHINMGTMLSFVTTDCAISGEMLEKALRTSVEGTYNCVSVDGDTSTNDSMVILANGMAENPEITAEGEDYDKFLAALNFVNTQMARKIAGDGEGAEHLLVCTVEGAKTVESARKLAKSVISSSLVKAAFFGEDANWGRILCALGYSGELFDPLKVSVTFTNARGSIKVFDHGSPVDFDESQASVMLSNKEVGILVQLEEGNATGTAWGCDLTYEYVKINGDYRS